MIVTKLFTLNRATEQSPSPSLSIKRLPNGSRGEETVNNKTQTQGKSLLFLFFCQKMEFCTHFVYFHSFSYKFKNAMNSHRVWAACGIAFCKRRRNFRFFCSVNHPSGPLRQQIVIGGFQSAFISRFFACERPASGNYRLVCCDSDLS